MFVLLVVILLCLLATGITDSRNNGDVQTLKKAIEDQGEDLDASDRPRSTRVIRDRAVFQVPVYYINMDAHTARRDAIENHLAQLHVPYYRRIPALTSETCNLLMVESPCLRVNFLDVAIMCSHLQALHMALNDPDPLAQMSDYFLVLEDDVRFLWAIDFERLINQAPVGFGALQLMLSHRPHLEEVWERFMSTNGDELFTYRPRNSSVWSAQAILYRKDAIRSFVDAAVVRDRRGRVGFKMVNSFQYDKLLEKPAARPKAPLPSEVLTINPFRPVVACECLFADMFLYAMARPAFMSTLPLLNSAAQGMKSTIHQNHVAFHIHGFLAAEEFFTMMVKHLREEVAATFSDETAAAVRNGPVDWPVVAQNVIRRLLPHSTSDSVPYRENKARPSYLVHPLVPAAALVDEAPSSHPLSASSVSANVSVSDGLRALTDALQRHLAHILLPAPLRRPDATVSPTVFYNATQWRVEAAANPVEPWVFARIYGDIKKDNVHPRYHAYLRDERKPVKPHPRHAQRHWGPTNT